MSDQQLVVGIHDFDWLYTQVHDTETQDLVDRIVAIEKSYMDGRPIPTGTDLLKLRLGNNIIWTRENTTHTIPFGYVQIFKLLDEILPTEFRQPMHNLVVDVGANEGHWSLYMCKQHPGAAILAIEPNPIPLELMKKNFESNNIKNVEILPIAISKEASKKDLETIDNVTSLGSFKIDRTGRPWITDARIRRITVECKRLDDLKEVKNAVAIDLLKVDVEGAELEVIEGAAGVLDKIIRLEIEYGSEENRAKLLEILKFQGFKLLLDYPYSRGRGDLFFYRVT